MLLMGNITIEGLIAAGLVLFFGMGFHEYAHALVADWWGDPTPREHGRLTPNPIVHINWVGWLMFLLIGFGILGSVPVSPNRMRNPRWGSFWTSFAGPLSNLIQAGVFALVYRLISSGPGLSLLSNLGPDFLNSSIFGFLILVLNYGVLFNVLLFVFNLLPLFPIDGWRMMLALLPGRGMERKNIPNFLWQNVAPIARFLSEPAYTWQAWAQVTQYVFFGLLLLSFALPQFSIFNFLIGEPTFAIYSLLLGF
jgi:Zn-dependent protease